MLRWVTSNTSLKALSHTGTPPNLSALQQIAEKFNAKFIQRKFDNYASQRNAALKEVNNKSRWILMVDADEIVSESLKIEIKNIIKSKKLNLNDTLR